MQHIQVVRLKIKNTTNNLLFISIMSNTFLDGEQDGASQGGKGSFEKYQLKIRHLSDINKKISIENQHLHLTVNDLQKEKASFVGKHFDQNTIILNFQKELNIQRAINHQLSKKNQQLLAKILLNEQLNAQSIKQFDFYINRYQEKIMQLRQSLQKKQAQIQTLQEKDQKSKGLQLPISIKNANRYTAEMLKYENLIDELIQERNNNRYKNNDDIHNALKYFDRIESQPHRHQNKKTKTTQSISGQTELRLKNTQISQQAQYSNKFFGKDKIDIMFLKLNLQLRQLKKKYKEKQQQMIELKKKDQIMKQGYLTLTKVMQKVKIQNCQLKIQLEHLDRKIKTTKEINNNFMSKGNISKRRDNKFKIEAIVETQISIDANLSDVKRLKVSLPSQTKNDTLSANKSHTFDQQIQNIEGLLSLDSSPDMSRYKSRKQVIFEGDQDEELSIQEQNDCDMSISLDASGFVAPKKQHQFSENVITELFENRIF